MTGWENITANNGVAISVTGMAIVFVVLILISLYIAVLPKILKVVSTFLPENEGGHHRQVPDDHPDEELEIVVAVAAALQRRKQVTQAEGSG